MTTMSGDVYDAFLEAGASPEKARKAAEAVAGYDTRIGKLDGEQATGFSRMEQRFARLEAELTIMKWMGGAILAGVITLVVRAIFPG